MGLMEHYWQNTERYVVRNSQRRGRSDNTFLLNSPTGSFVWHWCTGSNDLSRVKDTERWQLDNLFRHSVWRLDWHRNLLWFEIRRVGNGDRSSGVMTRHHPSMSHLLPSSTCWSHVGIFCFSLSLFLKMQNVMLSWCIQSHHWSTALGVVAKSTCGRQSTVRLCRITGAQSKILLSSLGSFLGDRSMGRTDCNHRSRWRHNLCRYW
jgi:hypothetical protein